MGQLVERVPGVGPGVSAVRLGDDVAVGIIRQSPALELLGPVAGADHRIGQ